MRPRNTLRLVLALTLISVLILFATPLTAADSTLKGELTADLAQLEEKIVGLAKAIPADEFGWAPAEGVRRVSQALMHTATANFFFATMLDVAAPEGVDLRSLEEIEGKDECVKLLEQSYDHLRQAIEGADDLTMAKSYFGREGSVAGLLHAALSHNHEHLGQMIAYGRANGVTPPWSQ